MLPVDFALDISPHEHIDAGRVDFVVAQIEGSQLWQRVRSSHDASGVIGERAIAQIECLKRVEIVARKERKQAIVADSASDDSQSHERLRFRVVGDIFANAIAHQSLVRFERKELEPIEGSSYANGECVVDSGESQFERNDVGEMRREGIEEMAQMRHIGHFVERDRQGSQSIVATVEKGLDGFRRIARNAEV